MSATTRPAAHPIEQRRAALMQARTIAIAARDWVAMNTITKRLAKLPTKTSGGVYVDRLA